jgi:hypothetical protein
MVRLPPQFFGKRCLVLRSVSWRMCVSHAAAAVTKSLGEVLPEFHKAFATNSYIDRQLGLLPADVASGSVDLSAVPARDRYRVRQQLNVAKTRLTEKKLTVEELDLQRSALIAAIRAALSVEERALEKVSTMREVWGFVPEGQRIEWVITLVDRCGKQGLERLRTDYSQLKAKEASGLKVCQSCYVCLLQCARQDVVFEFSW